MTPKDPTAATRKAAERERKRVAGLEEVRGIWADKALHPAIKEAACKLSWAKAQENMMARSWITPTTWDERFREALTVLCGEPPPPGSVEAWFEPGCDSIALQEWACDKCQIPWAQGIVVIDSAEMLANDPAEGGMHADRP